jgi:hypothetical protein
MGLLVTGVFRTLDAELLVLGLQESSNALDYLQSTFEAERNSRLGCVTGTGAGTLLECFEPRFRGVPDSVANDQKCNWVDVVIGT